MNCRMCGAPARLLADRGDVALFRCRQCRFVSGQPAPSVSLEERYHHYYDTAPAAAPEGRYDEWLTKAERQRGPGRLLEIGGGSGGFVRVARRRGWTVDATEVSSAACRALQETGARVFQGRLKDAAYGAGAFDLVVCLEVLEHVPEPLQELREIHRVLAPGGRLLLTTPNFGGLSRRWLGIRWRVVDPEHLGYFTPGTLRRALRQAGFQQASVRSRSLDISSWRPATDGRAAAAFDPQASACLRDGIESRPLLRTAKNAVNVFLAATALGDSLLAWAERY